MKHKILLLYSWLVRTMIFFLPDTSFIMRFRGWLYCLGMKQCGKDFQVTHDAILRDLENISVGNGCFIGNGGLIMGSGEIIIESDVLIGPRVVIISGNHTSSNGAYKLGNISKGNIVIRRGSWVASNATIQKGSTLPANSVLSANSFLNKNHQTPNSIYGGVPARLIKTLDNASNFLN